MSINDKAYEVGLALIKLSVYARRREFGYRLERLAFSLIEDTNGRSLDTVVRHLSVAEGLIRFGRMIYEIEPMNADIVLKEIESFHILVREIREVDTGDFGESSYTLESIFSKPLTLFEKPKRTRKKRAENGNSANNAAKEVPSESQISVMPETGEKSAYDNPAIRQSAIADKMRQFKNNEAKLKDIIAAFPQFSERTLRYDLQRLCDADVVERIGQGGPATYYKVR